MLISLVSICKAQPIKFKVNKKQTIWLDKYNEISMANPWKDTSFIIVMDLKDQSITMYKDQTVSYSLTGLPEIYDDETQKDFKWLKWWTCLDKEGTECTIRLLKYKGIEPSVLDRGVLYVGYANIMYLYSIKNAP